VKRKADSRGGGGRNPDCLRVTLAKKLRKKRVRTAVQGGCGPRGRAGQKEACEVEEKRRIQNTRKKR